MNFDKSQLNKQAIRESISHLSKSFNFKQAQEGLSLRLKNFLTDFLNHIMNQKEKLKKVNVALFRPIQFEPRIELDFHPMSPLRESLYFKNLRYCWPVVQGEQLLFKAFKNPLEVRFSISRWGIEEPAEDLSEVIATQDIDLFFVPGMAFDFKGYRLGRGRGYYDKALHQTRGLKVGTFWSYQKVYTTYPEAHDVALDWIFTERYVFRQTKRSA